MHITEIIERDLPCSKATKPGVATAAATVKPCECELLQDDSSVGNATYSRSGPQDRQVLFRVPYYLASPQLGSPNSYLAIQVLSCRLSSDIPKGVTALYPPHAVPLPHHHQNVKSNDQAFPQKACPRP